jgi:hypothetical protein
MPEDRREQQPEAAPVVEDERLPRMADIVEEPYEVREGAGRMPEVPPAAEGGKRRMDPRPSDTTQTAYMPMQQPRQQAAADRGESYLRLTVHNENGELTVVAAREVEGPLTVAETLPSGVAWDVSVGNRRIATGHVPDAGVVRAFANRDVAGPEGRHGFFEVSSFDFNVRIPRQEVAPDVLPHLRISLHRLHKAPEQPLGTEPLHQQLSEEEFAEIGHLEGLSGAQLAEPAQSELERILQVRL